MTGGKYLFCQTRCIASLLLFFFASVSFPRGYCLGRRTFRCHRTNLAEQLRRICRARNCDCEAYRRNAPAFSSDNPLLYSIESSAASPSEPLYFPIQKSSHILRQERVKNESCCSATAKPLWILPYSLLCFFFHRATHAINGIVPLRAATSAIHTTLP